MIIYLMIHIPFVWFVKIGFAHDSPIKRAAALDKAVIGFFFPVCFIAVPFAFRLEQMFHRTFRFLHFRFYRGDGSTETYLLPAAIPALIGMLLVWAVYWWAAGRMFGFDGLDWFWTYLQALWFCLKTAFTFLKSLFE